MKTDSERPIRIGVIGTNYISDNFCTAAMQVPGIELYAVYSRKQETGEAFARKYGIGHIHSDYDQFLSCGLDAVYVASPNYVHCAQTLKALEQKKHVLCEKVMAVNEKEVSAMIECALRNKAVLLEAMRPDFDPAFTAVESALPRIGKLRRATFEYCQYSGRYDSFRNGEVLNAFDPSLCNAAIMDIGVYCIHSLVRFFGAPRDIKAFSTFLDNGFEGSGIVLMKYDGFLAEAVYSKISVSVNPCVIQGEDGSILINHIGQPQAIEVRRRSGTRDPLNGGISEMLPLSAVPNNMVYEIQEFLRLIRAGEVRHKYLQYSLDAIRVMDEARRQNKIIFPGEA